AVRDGELAVIYAERSENDFQRITKRATHAAVLHQLGCCAEAEKHLRDAEVMQSAVQPEYPLLYGLQGFRYYDLLLTTAEIAAWRQTCEYRGARSPSPTDFAEFNLSHRLAERHDDFQRGDGSAHLKA